MFNFTTLIVEQERIDSVTNIPQGYYLLKIYGHKGTVIATYEADKVQTLLLVIQDLKGIL